MATSFASEKPTLPIPSDGINDPFVSHTPVNSHHRYSGFDQDLFAAGPGSSPRQAKRALEAHLAETERRIEEAGRLGTALVSQQKTLKDRLLEVDKLQTTGELTSELRQKLVDLEKEYNDLTRESARAFLPRSRVPSNETNSGSPFAPDSAGPSTGAAPRSGRRSVSPSKFESHATGSPTKLTVPNRKIRNQPSNRVHDIEFAAEISTSLIAQVRNLQSMLAERDEELKDTQFDKSKLEIDIENLQQRLKTLDESENRYREENWNLETRIQEMSAQQKESADREKKLTQALNTLKADKSAVQRDLDEVKVTHARLIDQHAAAVKQHDIELGTAKRNILIADGERASMQRRIDDLTSQNHELARAFAMTRGRVMEREPTSGMSDEDFEAGGDSITPEHSPPQSPMKGTPRHAMLETETMKSSLQHAQRTIQSQRSLLHREKTEKLEMRRIIQDLRDDLEKARSEQPAAPVVPRRSRKPEPRDFKKPPRLLGSYRSSRQEVFHDTDLDAEWEDQNDISPRSVKTTNGNTQAVRKTIERTDSGEHFETANETTESAFETANERGTETEGGFHTGNEESTASEGDNTETETVTRGFGRMRKPPSLPANISAARSGIRGSFDSTASTSSEEDEFPEMRSPTATASQRNARRRLSRGTFSRSQRQVSEELMARDASASFSSSGDHDHEGQSLFAELQDCQGSDEDSTCPLSPGQQSIRSMRSATPGSIRRPFSPPPPVPALPKPAMVDSGMVTDPVQIIPAHVVINGHSGMNTGDSVAESDEDQVSVSTISVVPYHERPVSSGSVFGSSERSAPVSALGVEEAARPVSLYSDAGAQFDPEMEQKLLAQFPTPPTAQPILAPQPELSISDVQSLSVEPREEVIIPPAPPALSFTSIVQETVEPVAEPAIPPPDLTLSHIYAHNLEPVAEPKAPIPTFSFTPILAQDVEPVAEPEVPAPALSLSNMVAESVDPVPEPEVATIVAPRPALSISAIHGEQVEPVAELERELQPVSAPFIPVPEPARPTIPQLTISSISAQALEPVAEPAKKVRLPALNLTPIHIEHWEPREEPKVVPEQVALAYSKLVAEQVKPVMEPLPTPPTLDFSAIAAEGVEPVSPVKQKLAPPRFAFSPIEAVETCPLCPRSPKRDGFILPRDAPSPLDEPVTPVTKSFKAVLGRNKNKDAATIIAEDETRQSPRDASEADTPESQRPFKEISSNSNARPARKAPVATADQGAQTSLTADTIDELFKTKSRPALNHQKSTSVGSVGSPDTIGTVRIHRSHESFDTPSRNKSRAIDEAVFDTPSITRPDSAASHKQSVQGVPPLPPNHRQVIEAARSNSAHGSHSNMGPPLWPASALKNRPVTPNHGRPMSPMSARGTPTPRAARTDSSHERAEDRSVSRLTARSRQSSVSSFVSELDTRFNMRPNEGGMIGFGPNTDPRMIQAITQTMIGEYLWKYTRKPGRGEMSENRHRRYFWVHPYTRTLYWSDRDPSTAGRSELKAKSVPIEAVRVVTDDNPMPPGLHRKSMVIVSPGRTIKFTCTTGQRHETWFNALSYLLLRTNDDGQHDAEEMVENITREDVDEFNPQYGRRTPHNGTRPGAAPSLSSYNSRTTRNESPAAGMSMNIPTLTPTPKKNASTAQRAGTLSKISGYWKSRETLAGTFTSRRSRAISGYESGIYEASEVHDSAEDLREMIERQDREADRLENVRACCDGKHDVGTLHHSGKKVRPSQVHSHTS